MNTGYTPVQGRGFVRPEKQNLQNFAVISGLIGGSETNIVNARALQMFDDEKGVNLTYPPDGNQNMSIISESVFYKLIKTKSAPLPERPCEQLTYCAKNESVRGDYINRGRNDHSCRITGKTKATAKGRQWVLRQIKLERITNNATFAAGGQCDQCAGLLVGYSCSLALLRNRAVSACFLASSASLATSSGERSSDALSILARPSLTVIFLGSSIITCASLWLLLIKAVTEQSVTEKKFRLGYSCSLALRRWRRLISPSSAETINCPVLSPSSFKFSTASAIAWGTRASSFLDFPLTAFVAISDFLVIRWLTVYTQENGKTLLTWLTPVTSIVADTFIEVIDEKTKPAGATNTNGPLTTNDNESIEVAMLNHTTHPQGRDSHNLNKYIWRFIALSTAQPRVITIEATSEQEARQQSPDGCVMVFAARIRQGVRHVQ
ncbi:TPA: host cell division inhibitor Icd-like protein [Escherichia coli]|nr:host cell division inhibitor Icd-like protein [Escherichia coli]EFG2177668.1 host cell division inhibitor Icd-like protein [Escherichia coli]EFK1932693.1 host cell division inhibitor Icd-like protein [Escherichia coli]EFL5790896.1 host cell division inhibitor Icd-like protein [Escherichia coli]EFM8837941.1 host cell division inhibitor Icd-like protein [Escherichia coli]